MRGSHQYNGGDALNNTLACFSLYCGVSSCKYHNEIAICLDPRDPEHIHFNYWVGADNDTRHAYFYKPEGNFNFSRDFHTYGFIWENNTSLQFTLDGQVVQNATPSGLKDYQLPFEYMNMKIILRPNLVSEYTGNQQIKVGFVSYEGLDMISKDSIIDHEELIQNSQEYNFL